MGLVTKYKFSVSYKMGKYRKLSLSCRPLLCVCLVGSFAKNQLSESSIFETSSVSFCWFHILFMATLELKLICFHLFSHDDDVSTSICPCLVYSDGLQFLFLKINRRTSLSRVLPFCNNFLKRKTIDPAIFYLFIRLIHLI